MGLRTGIVLEVVSDQCAGRSVIVMAGAMRLMLDCELAQKVRVVPITSLDHWQIGRGRRRRHRHLAEGGRDTQNGHKADHKIV
jgi:hypothetical protein